MGTLNSIFFDFKGQPTSPSKEKIIAEWRSAAASMRFAAGEANALSDPFFEQFSPATFICVSKTFENTPGWLINSWVVSQ